MSQDGVTWTESVQCCFLTTWRECGFPRYLGALTKHHGHVEPFLNIGHLLIMHLKNLSKGKLSELRSNKRGGHAQALLNMLFPWMQVSSMQWDMLFLSKCFLNCEVYWIFLKAYRTPRGRSGDNIRPKASSVGYDSRILRQVTRT